MDERSSKANEHADFDRCTGRYLEPRPRSLAGGLRGFLPRREVQGGVPRDRRRADRQRRTGVARGHGEGRERGRQGREPLSPPPVARLLRRRAAPGAPLRSGEPSLANDVTILAELQFVKSGRETSE